MIVIDAEFSGLDSSQHCLLSLGAIDYYNPQDRFYGECYGWEGATFDPESLTVNGFLPSALTDTQKLSPYDLLQSFFTWCKEKENRTIAGHNVWLDREFLVQTASRVGLPFRPHRIIDLHSIAVGEFMRRGLPIPLRENESALSANVIYEYVGLPKEPFPHHALTGALMEAEAFSRILHQKNILPEFAHYPLPKFS